MMEQTWKEFDDGTSTLTTAVVTTHNGVALEQWYAISLPSTWGQ